MEQSCIGCKYHRPSEKACNAPGDYLLESCQGFIDWLRECGVDVDDMRESYHLIDIEIGGDDDG